MTLLSFDNPVFAAYAVASSLMIGKMIAMSRLTIIRMALTQRSFATAEDTRITLANPRGSPDQMLSDDRVERVRRIHRNDTENVPLFLSAGLMFVLVSPAQVLAFGLFGAFVASRFLHFAIYMLALPHEVRAASWALGSLSLLVMTATVLTRAFSAL